MDGDRTDVMFCVNFENFTQQDKESFSSCIQNLRYATICYMRPKTTKI